MRALLFIGLLMSSISVGMWPFSAAVAVTPANGNAPANYNDYGFIYNSLKEDGVYNSLAGDAILRFEKEHRLAVRQRVAASAADSERAIRDMASRGVGTIILLGFQHTDALTRTVGDFPAVRFTLIDGEFAAPNVRSIVFKEEEAGYLVGVAAARASQSNYIGFIGGMPIPPVRRYGCGFLQGASSQKPDIRVSLRYLARQGDGFRNAALARLTAEAMLNDGVDVLFPAAGIAGLAALDATARGRRLGIGVDSNHNGVHPGYVLTSAVKRVDEAVYRSLNDSWNNRWTAGTTRLGLAEGGVGWSRDVYNETLVAEMAPFMDAARDAIVSGQTRIASIDSIAECRGD
jgi:basic membrane protein A and related proteins